MRTEKYRWKTHLCLFEKVFEKEELGWNKEPLNGVGFVDENDKKSGEWKLYRRMEDKAVGSFKDGKQEGEWKDLSREWKVIF